MDVADMFYKQNFQFRKQWSFENAKFSFKFAISTYYKVADVMLVGAYLFEDPDDPRNFKKTITVKL
nr:Serine/threonine-protein kinase [Ipomoea batatas]